MTLEERIPAQRIFILEETEFSIERIEKDTTEIHIKMTKNQTASNRILDIGLESANYYDRIRIIQADTTKLVPKNRLSSPVFF
jgi:hypothetical protein